MRVPGVRKSEFRKALVTASGGCAIQHNGWPCGTDFPGNQEEWHAVLAYRGDYDKNHRILKEDGTVVYRMATDIVFDKDGTYSHHVFTEIPEEEVKQKIRKMAKRLGVAK